MVSFHYFFCMPTKQKIIDLYFMSARCNLLEIAAYQDRIDRHQGDADFRFDAFQKALLAMQNPAEGETRTQAVLNSLSDVSDIPAEKADISFAYGAPKQ